MEFRPNPNPHHSEEEKAAATTSKPEISAEEAFDEIEDDNNEAKETRSPSAANKFESSSEEAVRQVDCDNNKAIELYIHFRSHKRPIFEDFQKRAGVLSRRLRNLKEISRNMKEGIVSVAKSTTEMLDSKFITEVQESQRGAEENKGRSASKRLINPPDVMMCIMVAGIAGFMSTIIDMMVNYLNRGKALTFLEVTWLLFILISCSISIWIVLLDVIGYLSSLTLPLVCILSIFSRPLLHPATGMFVVQLSSHYIAGFLGYALAQRHMNKGKYLNMYKVPTPENKEVERPHILWMVATLIHILLNLGVILRLAWVLSHSPDYNPVDLMMHCLLPLIGGVLFWITFVVVSLGDDFIGDGGFALVVFYLFFIMLNYILMVVTLGDAMATLATWFASLGLSGFLGYSVRIYILSRITKDLGSQVTSQQSSHPHSSS